MLKDNLKKITEKAKLKSLFDEDMKEFVKLILKGWLDKCAEAANEGETEVILVAFDADAKFANHKIKYLIKCGLIEYIKKITELDVYIQEFIVHMGTKEVVEIKSPQFNKLFENDIFLHYYVIKISWN